MDARARPSGRCRAVAPPRRPLHAVERPGGGRRAARGGADRLGGAHVPQRRGRRSAGAVRPGVADRRDARRGRRRARRAEHGRRARAAGRRPLAGRAAATARSCRCRRRARASRPRWPSRPTCWCARASPTRTGSACSHDRHDRRRAAPRSARGGRRAWSSDRRAVRRCAPLRPPRRGLRAHGRAHHPRRRARVSRSPLAPQQRHAGGGRRLRRGDAAGPARGGASATGPARRRPTARAAGLARRARASCSSIARARPRASCAWSAPGDRPPVARSARRCRC